MIRIDRDGRLEAAGLAGAALAIEDIPAGVDDQDIVGAIAGDIGDQGRVIAGEIEHRGSKKRAVAVAQQHLHVAGLLLDNGQVGLAVAGEVARWQLPSVLRLNRPDGR